jgi:hypothetical protein
MKKLFTLLVFVLVPVLINAQTLLDVNFSGGYPPAGWTIDAQPGNWSAVSSANAGGTAPELRFNYSPTFTGLSHFISPSVNTTGQTMLAFQFKYYLDHYGGPYTIGVATRSNGGTWNTVWSIVNPTASGQGVEVVSITNSDVGSANFQISLFFSGYSYNLNYWYIDDVRLFIPLAHDVMVKDVLTNPEYVAGTPFTPQALLKNFGSNSETFNATCVIKLNGSSVYTQNCSNVTLSNFGTEQTVSFPDFTPTAANDLYEVTVTTNLVGDLDPSNDSRTEIFDTYTTERNMVVLEIGTGTWCTYCPGAALGADELVTNGHSVAVIENHGPTGQDPFANTYSVARNSYYAIPGYPTAMFDGVETFVGGDHVLSNYQYYLPIYQQRKAKNSAFTVGVYGEHSGNDYSVSLLVSKVAVIPSDWTNLVIHLALTESGIVYSWQGQTHLEYVNRLMVPNQNGTALDFSTNTTQTVNLNFTLDPTWVVDELELVAFIQNLDGKEILQGGKIALTELAPLPVELTSFTAKAYSGKVQLDWTTATEINNSGFEVERSLDGSTFFPVGFVKGNGTITEARSYSFIDEIKFNATQPIYYRLKQVDYNGSVNYSDVVSVVIEMPIEYALGQNYPNPFNPSTKIKYSVPQNGLVSIVVYDLTGQEVGTLLNEVKEPGNYELDFNAAGLSSGVYFYKMTANNFSQVKKLSILK